MQGECCHESDLSLYPVVLTICSGPVCKMILVAGLLCKHNLWCKTAKISYINSVIDDQE